MKKVLCLVLLVALAIGAASCQMVGGLGEDITWIAQKTDNIIVD